VDDPFDLLPREGTANPGGDAEASQR
jgi:hypothetical protein